MIRLNFNNIKTLEFIESQIKIGRNKNVKDDVDINRDKEDIVNIFFKDDKSISRNHCEIYEEESQWFILDEKSTNGTFLNGKKLPYQKSFKLKDRDKVYLGKNTFISIYIESDETKIDFNKDINEKKFFDKDREITNFEKTRLYREEKDLELMSKPELPISTLLNNQYKIIKLINNSNNFIISYLAKDIYLNSYVIIKEYFPKKDTNRDMNYQIVFNNESSFRAGYNALNERLRLIKNIPKCNNIINVIDSFEENQTIYYVLEYIKGTTLEEYLHKNYPLKEKTIKNIVSPIIDGIRHLHKYNYIHGDIKLSNIRFCQNGFPIIIDLNLTAYSKKQNIQELEPYKSIEQQTKSKEGVYTDIYEIGMLIYSLINGIFNSKKLPSSKERLNILKIQGISPLNFKNQKKYSKNFLKAVQQATSVRAIDRPQTIEEFSKLLNKRRTLFSWLFF